ncbi:Outer-membrane lipoprotein carrier protein [Candidatus Hartigia pinicola]|nr:Outer-membrane lipoprotein carrier protein [Candidatus Hartigia pinicola]
MKNIILLFIFTVILDVNSVLANASQELQNRLNKIKSFHSSFLQKVISPEGDIIQEGSGELWLQRPNRFHWKMISPDQNILVSNGKILWFYSPFVNQVTVTNLSDATQDTPFLLITRNNPLDWEQYCIMQHGDTFDLKSKWINGIVKHFSITVSPKGTVEKFSAIVQDGQTNDFQLKEQKNCNIDKRKFLFIIPKSAKLDDQRAAKK